MRRRTIGLAAVVGLVALAAGWYFGSPWWTLYQMRSAAEARDSERLSSYVDFRALRANTKAQLDSELRSKARDENAPAARIGAAIARNFADRAIDAAISPGAIALLFANLPERSERGRGADGGSRSDGRSGGKPEVRIVRYGFSEFHVRPKAEREDGRDLVFRRAGLGWKLVRIGSDGE